MNKYIIIEPYCNIGIIYMYLYQSNYCYFNLFLDFEQIDDIYYYYYLIKFSIRSQVEILVYTFFLIVN